MKNKYLSPKMLITQVSTEDILTTSPAADLSTLLNTDDNLDVVDRVTW